MCREQIRYIKKGQLTQLQDLGLLSSVPFLLCEANM